MANESKVLAPKELADQLFEAALAQVKDPREAARQVILFLKESLVYAVSATAVGDAARKALLKSVGDSIGALPESQTAPQTP
jgi:hypothetical protein